MLRRSVGKQRHGQALIPAEQHGADHGVGAEACTDLVERGEARLHGYRLPTGTRKRTFVVGVAIVALVGAAVAAWGYTSLRWGCPSYAEANRPRTAAEVIRAFRDNGTPLVPAPRESVAGRKVFRHATAQANVSVVVCATNGCAPNVARLTGGRSRFRRGLSLLNVRIWLAAANAHAAKPLLARTNAAASALSPTTHDTRCFPN